MIEDNSSIMITRPENISEGFRAYFEKLLNRDSITKAVEQEGTIY